MLRARKNVHSIFVCSIFTCYRTIQHKDRWHAGKNLRAHVSTKDGSTPRIFSLESLKAVDLPETKHVSTVGIRAELWGSGEGFGLNPVFCDNGLALIAGKSIRFCLVIPEFFFAIQKAPNPAAPSVESVRQCFFMWS